MRIAYLVPVKAFHLAKKRLRGHLSDPDRIRLARWMAEQVLGALAGQSVFVATDDAVVAEWATELGAGIIWGPGLGLNGAVDAGVVHIAEAGYDHVTICHGDLPLPGSLTDVAKSDTIVLVPDRDRLGTNVVSRPVAAPLPALYGPGSFPAHLETALATRFAVSVRHDVELSLDFDTIEDAQHPLIAPVVRSLLGYTGQGEQ